MRLFLIFQVFIIGSYREHPQVRPYNTMGGVTEFRVSLLSLVHLENVLASDRLSYGWEDSLQHVNPVFSSFRERLHI